MASVIGLVSVIGCSKSNNNSSAPAKTDSIYYSPWIVLQMGFSQVDPGTGDSAFEQVISAQKITAAIVSHGAVLTYVIQQIPSAGDTVISAAEAILNPFIAVGSIDVYDAFGDASGAFFRYVIIPGTVLAATAQQGISLQQLRAMPFKDVTNLLKTAAKSETPVQLAPPQ
jgi:hypothetical protein